MKEQILQIIDKGEGINIEFKKSKYKLNRDVFESVCAFLNRNGGHLLLGVDDDGTIIGIDEDSIDKIKDNFVTLMNNPDKISPTFYLSVQDISIDGKTILYILVPESSQVHRCNGRIYDRNEDGDFDITDNTNLVAALYLRKQSSYTENRIFPYAEIGDLEQDILIKVRKLAENQKPNHPWTTMNDMELLKSA